MSPISLILRQNVSNTETRAVGQAALMADERIPVKTVSLEALADFAADLSGGALPVGSVEFVREAMRVAEIPEPQNLSYPEALKSHLRRDVRLYLAGEVFGSWFVKPVKTKLFTGFVIDTFGSPDALNEHDREQYNAFMGMSPIDPVWVSEPVKFVAEWRYYVLDGRIVGSPARYDPDGPDNVEEPKTALVDEMVRAFVADSGIGSFGIDVGRLDSGEVALVELNDGFSLGLYGGAINSKDYLALLWSRWSQLLAARSPASQPVILSAVAPQSK